MNLLEPFFSKNCMDSFELDLNVSVFYLRHHYTIYWYINQLKGEYT